jgi:hypothetical protein
MAGGSRETEERQDCLVLSALCGKRENRPDRDHVTRKHEVIRPVVRARSLAGTREGAAKHAEMASRSFRFLVAVRWKTPWRVSITNLKN